MKNKTPETYKTIYITLRIVSIILFVIFPIIMNTGNTTLGGFFFIFAIVFLIFSMKYHKRYNTFAGIIYTNKEKRKNRKKNVITSVIVVILTFISMGATMDTPEIDSPVSVAEKDSEEITTVKPTSPKATTTEAATTTQSPTTTQIPTTTEVPTTTQPPTTTQIPTTTVAPTTTQPPTQLSTEPPAIIQTPKPEPEPPVQTITEASNISYNSDMVWIVDTGKKYHSNASCSNMKNPRQVSRDEAIAMGRDACKKCY